MNIEIVRARLQELKNNHQAGEERLKALETQRQELQLTMMRISGAIQVLEELIAEQGKDGNQ